MNGDCRKPKIVVLQSGYFTPYLSLGNMLTEAQGYMPRNPWLATYPGIIIFLTILAINFLGDALRDALDPRSRR